MYSFDWATCTGLSQSIASGTHTQSCLACRTQHREYSEHHIHRNDIHDSIRNVFAPPAPMRCPSTCVGDKCHWNRDRHPFKAATHSKTRVTPSTMFHAKRKSIRWGRHPHHRRGTNTTTSASNSNHPSRRHITDVRRAHRRRPVWSVCSSMRAGLYRSRRFESIDFLSGRVCA